MNITSTPPFQLFFIHPRQALNRHQQACHRVMSQGQRKKLSTSKLAAMTPLQRPSRVAQRTSPLTGTLNFAAVITTTPPGAPCPPAPARRRRSVLVFPVFLIIALLPYPSLPSAVSPVFREVTDPEPPPTALTHSFSNQLTLHINVPRGASCPEPQIWKGQLARPGRSGSIPSQLSQTRGFSFSAQTTKTN